jgi:hypothetical protein
MKLIASLASFGNESSIPDRSPNLSLHLPLSNLQVVYTKAFDLTEQRLLLANRPTTRLAK